MINKVSTDSRLKAAGGALWRRYGVFWIRFNTQPPEGGWVIEESGFKPISVSTHSRLKAAGSDV